MQQYIGCDGHKRYSIFAVVDERGRVQSRQRVEHDRETFRAFLGQLPPGSPIALETMGNWYWMVDEMEQAGHQPHLAHAMKAKLMMGQINKTDNLDAGGLGILLRNGTLPSVWIPPKELRDQRELPRMRMVLVGIRTQLKNRIQATLAKYALSIDEVSDTFGKRGRLLLEQRIGALPPETQRSMREHLKLLDQVQGQIEDVEQHMQEVIQQTPSMQLLMTLPGIGPILGMVLALEIGSVDRFPGPEHLASYAGTVPRIHSSGGKTFHGKVRPDVNRYVKWALVEAANVVMMHQRPWPQRHVTQLYQRIKQRKGHAKAVVAVARHLAEAAYWVLRKNEPYRDPALRQTPPSSIQGTARRSHESMARLVH